MSDRIFGGLGLALAVFFAWQASIIQDGVPTEIAGPRSLPYIISAVMGLASAYFLLKPEPEPDSPRIGRVADIGFAVLVMLAYAQALASLGFVISTAMAAAYLTWRLGARPLHGILIGIGTSVGIYVLFRLVLGLAPAPGPPGF